MSPHILVACTGSVATIKLPALLRELRSKVDNPEIKVVLTQSSKHFLRNCMEEVHQCAVQVLEDKDEWETWNKIGDSVLHIDLRRWADILVIAPLDANTLAKMAQGLCDNLLTCIVRAWDPHKPLLFCPAMNTYMWEHPATQPHIEQLRRWNYVEVPCVCKKLACGDLGYGGMAEVPAIAEQALHHLNNYLDATRDK